MERFEQLGADLGTLFINLSSEYPAILDLVFVLMACVGTLIIASGVVEVTRMGKPAQRSEASITSVLWKFAGGGMLVDMAFAAHIWSASLWGDYDPLDISEYVGGGSGDYAEQALMAASGLIVIAGYVALARAYMGIARLGKTPEEQRSELWGFILSRAVAGSAMISVLYLAKVFGNSVGG